MGGAGVKLHVYPTIYKRRKPARITHSLLRLDLRIVILKLFFFISRLANMLLNKALQLAMLAAAVLLKSRTEAATSPVVKFCGRQLSEIMSRVCHAYNSPWDTPTGTYSFIFLHPLHLHPHHITSESLNISIVIIIFR